MITPSFSWISVHCFPKQIDNSLLINSLLPIIQQLRQNDKIQQYFYIRYPEGGFHFRLRLQVVSGQEDAVRQLVEAGLKVIPGLERYSWENYEPELERYGGEVGVEIAEWQFHVASEIVGFLLSKKNPDYGTATWLAMTMQLAFLKAMDLSPDEAMRFCDFSSWAWVPYAVGETDISRKSKEEILVGLEHVFTLFEQAQAEQPEMVQQLQLLWKVLGDEQYQLDDWLKQWIAGNRQVKKALEQRWQELQPRSKEHRYPVRKNGPADAAEELR